MNILHYTTLTSFIYVYSMHFTFLFHKIQLNEAKCQFSEYSVLKPNQLWWTHDGQRLPPVSFNLNDYLRKFVVKQGFDLTAAAEGWNQMLVSSNTDLLWVQQLCLHPYQRLTVKQNGSSSSSSSLLIGRRFIQLSPLFNGLIAFDEDDWCSRNTVLWDSDEESDKTNDTFVHLIHYSIKCEKIIYRKHYKFIVQLDLTNSGPVYQCLYFQLLNKNDPIKIINILQSRHVSLHPDESLCDDRAEFDSILWIPSLSKNLNDLFIPCPFVGGFQITSLSRVTSEKPVCEYQTFATLESDCVINEGIEWTFDDPKCNIFEVNSISHHNCYASWKKDGLTYTLLHQDRKDDGFSIFTMVFSDIPEPLNPSDYTYGQSKPLWIYPGLSSKYYQYSTLLLDSHRSHIDTIITKNWNDPRTYESPAYQLQIRRAFGICDDEPTSCTKGCDHDIRNRLFCYKSCPVDDKKCKSSQWDSCTFKQNYQGHWNFIESTSNKNYPPSESHKSKWVSLIFGENYLIFMGETNESYLCIREVREVIQDWFIIRSRKQANGCQPRDICLELFQSGIRRSLDLHNTNAMEFRLSQSKKYGSNVKTLCSFESQSFSLNNKAKESSTALILVRNIEPFQMSNPYSDPPVKCGLYQMRLVGTMNINADYLINKWKLTGIIPSDKIHHEQFQILNSNNKSQYIQSVNMHQLSTKMKYDYLGYRINRYKKSPSYNLVKNTDFMYTNPLIHSKITKTFISCHIELSDFNRTHGSTGEFGNRIWIHNDCLYQQIQSSFNTSHVCLSAYNIIPVGFNDKRQLILITYHIITKTYYCWIFKEIKQNNIQRYLVFLFDTPQCQYHRLPSGDIQINEEEAIAHISLTSATCINCAFKSDQNSKEYSHSKNLKRPNVLRIQTNQLKQQRQSQRALRQSIQFNLKNINWRNQIDLCTFQILICLSFMIYFVNTFIYL
ncbi:unnamed protein product [Schistosoma haematobium]|nr:unnamed protein product [Schistosoma haematobium]